MTFLVEGFIKAIQLLISGDISTWSAVSATVNASTGSMLVSLLTGLPCGFVLGYFDFRFKRPIRTILDTLLALPTVCVGLIVYAFISSKGPLGDMGLFYYLPDRHLP
ncbi:MAG: hypothetical protein R2860_16025 [Desulfobacterales bacterium]